MVTVVKEKFGYDDALDVLRLSWHRRLGRRAFVPVFSPIPRFGRSSEETIRGWLYGNPRELLIQLLALRGQFVLLSFLGTLVILKVIDLAIGVRVDAKVEAIGLDITQDDQGYGQRIIRICRYDLSVGCTSYVYGSKAA